MNVQIHIVNAFTDSAHGNIGGNPAGIVLNADALSPMQKQYIANSIGLSETAFVSKSTTAPFKLDFFTPTRQIANCGHATVATISLLRDFGLAQTGFSAIETIDGVRKIIIGRDKVFLEQSRAEFIQIAPHRQLYQDILDALNINVDMIEDNQSPFIVNTGNKFMIIPIKNAVFLKSIKPNQGKIERISKTFGLIGFYPFTFETNRNDRIASARMFAPLYGINEEPATGMGAGCLVAYLYRMRDLRKNSFQIEQGYLMSPQSPSVISAHIKKDSNDRIQSLLVGGQTKLSSIIELEI